VTETHDAVVTGLTSQEAARRLAADGLNELPTAKKRNLPRQAWDVVWHGSRVCKARASR
jgi:Ca2+-transporting ATPase